VIDPCVVDLVVPDPEVDRGDRGGRVGFEPGVEHVDGGAPAKCAVGSVLVVVLDEPVELGLQLGERGRGGLFGQELLFGLVEPFDAPMLSSGVKRGRGFLRSW
jgi:hypothetical protein